ncbi:MAG: hypothetical protein Q7K35_01380 [bacterium]|nr:hypothetical protein [bacterium]
MENPNFLKQKYDLQKSPEVKKAARRTEARTGKEFSLNSAEDADVRIQNYLDRFNEILNRQDEDKRGRGIEAFRQILRGEFIIKPNEIPEAYFNSVKERQAEEGRPIEEIPPSVRESLGKTIVKDQERSLDRWVNYLTSHETDGYPDWLKYFVFRNILSMGRYDKKKKAFTERRGKAIAPFPDLNHEALTIVMEDMKAKYEPEPEDGSKKPKSGIQFTGRHDINSESKQKYLEFLEKKNFEKLYALTLEEFKPIPEELLKVTEGKWILYPRGSDPKPLVDSISEYGTGWCLRGEDMARRYLQGVEGFYANDLHIYYSNDQDGKPTIPRAVMVVNPNNQIDEMRGVAEGENLDPYIGGIVQAKLNEHPDGKKFEKKSADMKYLTAIDKKVKAGGQLNREELVFLYEINTPIESFGLDDQRDPRIAKLLEKRNPEADAPIVFECEPNQIAWSETEVNEKIKAYIGPFFPGIFQKGFEYIYTSFPEGKIRKYNIEIGGKTKNQLEKEMAAKNIYISYYAYDLLKKLKPLNKAERIDLIRLTVKDLGFSNGATTDEIYNRAEELGLELCPAEAGPHLRLQYPEKERLLIATEQIIGRYGDQYVFGLDLSGDRLELSGSHALPSNTWRDIDEFVFRLRPSTKA